MPEILQHDIKAPFAWRGADLRRDESWIWHLAGDDIADIHAALQSVKARGLALSEIDRAAFPLPRLSATLDRALEQIRHGLGFTVIRGLPIANYSDEDAGMIFWGLGSHLGAGLRQNAGGDLLGHVYDRGRPYGTAGVRGHESNAHLPFHTDYSDIVGLLCLRKAKSGGESSIVSAVTAHNELLARDPDALALLYRGFYYIKREAELSDNPATEDRIPVFSHRDGNLFCRYLRVRIETAAARIGTPLTESELVALDLLDAITLDRDIHLDMDLQAGDIQFCNDYRLLHSRTGYEDWPEPERARHMLRLWIRTDDRGPFPENFPASNGYARVGEAGFETARELGLVSLQDV